MRTLSQMVGEEIVALVPFLDRVKLQRLKLLAIEPNGLWVESSKFTSGFMRTIRAQRAPKSLVLFFPFNQITFVMSSIEVPAALDDGE
jgi:hypothetical protein